MSVDNWFLFFLVALVATTTPGPAVFLVVANSVSYGVKRAVFSIIGNVVGLFCMSLLSILGLSAIILNSAPVFIVVKMIGSLYLIYLGIKIWRNGFNVRAIESSQNVAVAREPSARYKLFFQGLLVALSNPKAIAFTTALFPQFIQPESPLIPQFLILVTTFMSLSFICLLIYALMLGRIDTSSGDGWLTQNLSKVFGGVFVGSGLALAVTSQR